MAAPRKGTIGCSLICLTTLAASEYGVIHYLVQPLPSTRIDWQVATVFFAPMAAACLLWCGMLTSRIILDITTLLTFLTRCITRANHDTAPAQPDDPRLRWMSPGHHHVAAGVMDRRTPDPHAVEKEAP